MMKLTQTKHFKFRFGLMVCLGIVAGLFHQTECQAQRSTGLQPASGLQPSSGLHTAKGLHSDVKLDSMATPFSYRAPRKPPRVVFADVKRVPVMPNNTRQLYLKAKLAINKAGLPSILKKDGVGVLVAANSRVSAKPFVMEYTGYLENGESVYFVPRGMSDAIEIQRYQILSYLAYPPQAVLDQRSPENIKWMNAWIDYAERKKKYQSTARRHFGHLIEEAEKYVRGDEAESSPTLP